MSSQDGTAPFTRSHVTDDSNSFFVGSCVPVVLVMRYMHIVYILVRVLEPVKVS